MEECRVCLRNIKNLRSIYELSNGISTYADIITSLANVKITKNDGITDKICHSCCRKLMKCFDFKKMIERSDNILYESINKRFKKIYFYDISEIKTEIEFSEADNHQFRKSEDIKLNFQQGNDFVFYNETIIKKLSFSEHNYDRKTISVLEFLRNIKEEVNDDCSDIYQMDYTPDSDDEYLPSVRKLKNINKDRKRIHKGKKDASFQCKKVIKPIFLEDLRVIPTKRIHNKNKLGKKLYMSSRRDVCPYCGKITKTIKTHLLVHTGERKYKCDVCTKAFFRQSDLRNHGRKHSNVKDFKCDQCVAAFNNKCSLKSHMLMHIEEKRETCNICNKSFKRKAALTRHIRGHSSANKTFKCELCNMSFFSNTGLRHHMRVHTGERPYNCELCSQPYSYKHDFNRHCFKKHGIFLKRRSINVMNEEVLAREKALMKELMLKAHGIFKEGEPLNPFEGPQGALAFEQAMKVLKNNQIPITYQMYEINQ